MLRQMRSARRRRRRRQCFAQHADQVQTLLWGDDYCKQGCLVLQGSRKQILHDRPSAPGNAQGSVKTLECTAMHHQGRQDLIETAARGQSFEAEVWQQSMHAVLNKAG